MPLVFCFYISRPGYLFNAPFNCAQLLVPALREFPDLDKLPIAATYPQRGKRRNGLLQVQVIQWAANLTKGFGAYVGVDFGGLARAMPQQRLDVAKVGSLLQEVGGKAVA